jgi:hypothetical protein
MAKAKKSETKSEGPKTPAKKPAKGKPAPAPMAPMIDTGLAAEAAAKSVFAKGSSGAPSGPAPTTGTPQKESAAFKNLKASIGNPTGNSMASLLDKTAGPGQKKQNLPFHGGKQVGRNQTFGADVNRTGVPRRTGG